MRTKLLNDRCFQSDHEDCGIVHWKGCTHCSVGSGPRYQILSHVFGRCASQTTHGHARIARETRATSEKVWHKSYTSGHCLLQRRSSESVGMHQVDLTVTLDAVVFHYKLREPDVEPLQTKRNAGISRHEPLHCCKPILKINRAVLLMLGSHLASERCSCIPADEWG